MIGRNAAECVLATTSDGRSRQQLCFVLIVSITQSSLHSRGLDLHLDATQPPASRKKKPRRLRVLLPKDSTMPVELRKRKPREAPPPPPPKRTNKGGRAANSKVKQAAKKVEEEKVAEKEPEKEEEEVAEEVEEKVEEKTEEKAKDEKKKSGPLEVGDVIDLEDFGGEVETNDGETTTLKKLVDESKAGVVLFTYPKASTPGCKFHHPSHHFHL